MMTGSTDNNNFPFARKIMFSIPHFDAMPAGVLPIPIEPAQLENNIPSFADTQFNSLQSTNVVFVSDGGSDGPPR
jgi:hypothetical protein